MSHQTLSPRRAIWLLIKLAARRRFHRIAAKMRLGRKKEGDGRSATARKSAGGSLLLAFFGLIFVLNSFQMSTSFAGRLSHAVARSTATADAVEIPSGEYKQRLDEGSDPGPDALPLQRLRPNEEPWMAAVPGPSTWAPPGQEGRYRDGLALAFALLGLSLLATALGMTNVDLGKVDWSQEWLYTLPVGPRALQLAATGEAALFNPVTWLVALPLMTVLYVSSGWGWWALPLGFAGAAYIAALIGAAQVLAETWLRQSLPPSRIKNLQALLTLLGTVGLFSLLALAMTDGAAAQLDAIAAQVESIAWLNPLTLPLAAARGGASAWPSLIGQAALGAAAVWGAVAGGAWLVRDGLMIHGGAYSGARGGTAKASLLDGLRGVAGKELRALARDRTLLIQTLGVPILIIGFNVINGSEMASGITERLDNAATAAFTVGAYVLVFSAFHALRLEGQTLWLLYTFPRSIRQILLDKTRLWIVFALIYSLIIIAIAVGLGAPVDLRGVVHVALAAYGVAVYGFIAGALGTLNTDPLETVRQRQLKPTTVFIYFMLTGIFAYGLSADEWWAKLAPIILMPTLAYALWQKVADHSPYLLDPVDGPPVTVSLADGLIAVVGFFAAQLLVLLILFPFDFNDSRAFAIAFVIAGAATCTLALAIFWRRGVPKLLQAVGLTSAEAVADMPWVRSSLMGVVGGIGALALAQAYLALAEYIPPLSRLQSLLDSQGGAPIPPGPYLTAAIVIGAPVFEEVIFRGMVFKGLSRSLPTWVAIVGSAAIFAVVHPAPSFFPVLMVGLVCAWIFHRSKLLIGAILAHAVYNGGVIYLAFGG